MNKAEGDIMCTESDIDIMIILDCDIEGRSGRADRKCTIFSGWHQKICRQHPYGKKIE